MKKVAVTSNTHVMILVVSMFFHTFAPKISHVQNVPGTTTTSLKTMYSLILFHHPLLKLFHVLCFILLCASLIHGKYNLRFQANRVQRHKKKNLGL